MTSTADTTAPGQVVDRLFAALQAHDVDKVVQGCSEDVELTAPGEIEIRGREAFAEFVRGWIAAFPDISWEVTGKTVGADTVVIESVVRGTHTGTLRTPDGDVPPSGRRFENRVCEVDRVRHGQIVHTRLYWDTLPLARQLGLLPGSEGA